MSNLRIVSALAAIAALGSSLGPVVRLEREPEPEWPDFSSQRFQHVRAPRRRVSYPLGKKPAPFQASAAPVIPGANDTRDPKYLHSHARRARLSTPTQEPSDGG